MRGINYLAALGTIVIFISIYCFKAIPGRRVDKEGVYETTKSASSKRTTALLILAGSLSMLIGIALFAKAFKIL